MFNRLLARQGLLKSRVVFPKITRNISYTKKQINLPTVEARNKIFSSCDSTLKEFQILLQKFNLTPAEQLAFIYLMKARGTYNRLFWKNISAIDILRWEIKSHFKSALPFDIFDKTKIDSVTEFTLFNIEKNQGIMALTLAMMQSKQLEDKFNATFPLFDFLSSANGAGLGEHCYFLNAIMMKILSDKIRDNVANNEIKTNKP